jgi:organic hydroperoxide reductase OsmC/OhrA
MQEFPHHYCVTAAGGVVDNIELSSPGVPDMPSAAPAEFGGPGDQWSPETLLAGAVADCLILSFRAVARASKFDWISLTCEVDAVLDRVEKVTQFTEFRQTVVLEVPAGADAKKAMRLLERAEHVCLVTNSLTGKTHLDATVKFAN